MVATNTLTIATLKNVYQYSGGGWIPIRSGLIDNDIQSIAQFVNNSTGTPLGMQVFLKLKVLIALFILKVMALHLLHW